LNILSKFSYIWKFDRQKEEEYNLFVKPSNLASLRLVTFITIFGMSLFLIVDFFKEVDYSVVLASRICVLSLAFILMWLSYRDLSSTGIVLCVSLVPIMNFGASVVTSYYAGMPPFYITNLLFLIFVLVVTASGLHFRFALMVNLFCLIMFLLYSQFFNRNPFYFSQYPHLISIFVYIHIVGMVLENRRRTNFLQFNELKEQKKLVEELNQQKNRIISILSHDVAAPMNSLSTLLHLQTYNNIDKSELNTYLPKLSNQFENVTLLLYSLVRWSRSQMDGFKLDKVKLNVSDLVERKLKLFQFPLLDKGLELKLTVDRSLYITVDEEMILIAIQNLLSNAIKFAHPGSVVQVKVYGNQNQGVVISITNQGETIPEQSLMRCLFLRILVVKEEPDLV